jgi:hypothetical protein
MSFDLWFSTKDRSRIVDVDDIKSWFAMRPNYDKEALESHQGVYQNDDTGVYFIFEFGNCIDSDDHLSSVHVPQIVLFLNFLRPRFFAMECANEIQDLVQHFSLEVSDQQEATDEFLEFNADKFINSYVKSNRWAIAEMGSRDELNLQIKPSNELETVWRWNYNKRSRASLLEVDVFIPRIVWFVSDTKVSSGFVWPEGIPTLMPPSDAVYLVWGALAQKSLLGVRFGESKENTICDRATVQHLLDEFYKPEDAEGCRWPRDMSRPKELVKALKVFNPPSATPQILASDAVIDDIFVSDDKNKPHM